MIENIALILAWVAVSVVLVSAIVMVAAAVVIAVKLMIGYWRSENGRN